MGDDRWKMLWTCWLLPAGLGAAAAGAFVWLRPAAVDPLIRNPVPAQEEERAEAADESKRELPAGLPTLILAAQSGRTAEARQALWQYFQDDVDEESMEYLLGSILVTDPGYLEIFLKAVPEKRRDYLALGALRSLSRKQPDGFWRLLQRSPEMLALVQKSRQDSDPELGFWAQSSMTSPLAVQVLFDPAMGFTPEQRARFCMMQDVPVLPETAARVLEEWRDGHWPENNDECGRCLRQMWLTLGRQDPEKLQEFEKSLPPEQVQKYEAYAALMDRSNPAAAASDPPVEKLALLDSTALLDICTARSYAGQPVPLETLAQLPKGQRKWALIYCPDNLISVPGAAMRDSVAQLDALPLDPEEKQDFLMRAAELQWERHQDASSALDWLFSVPDGERRSKLTEGIFTGFSAANPQAALEYAATMPPGPDRDRLTEAAKANLP